MCWGKSLRRIQRIASLSLLVALARTACRPARTRGVVSRGQRLPMVGTVKLLPAPASTTSRAEAGKLERTQKLE